MNAQGTKYTVALAGAMLITLTLFLLMTRMISNSGQGVPELEHYDIVDFVRLVRERQSVDKEHRELPPERKPPPPPPDLDVQLTNAPPPVAAPMPMPSLNVDLRLTGGPVIGRLVPGSAPLAMDNEVMPLVQIPPVYPVRAERLGIGGTVVVEFTINETGLVENPVVVEAKPDKIFDQAAVQAILRWKFKPKLEDGKAVARRARQQFDFSPPSR